MHTSLHFYIKQPKLCVLFIGSQFDIGKTVPDVCGLPAKSCRFWWLHEVSFDVHEIKYNIPVFLAAFAN